MNDHGGQLDNEVISYIYVLCSNYSAVDVSFKGNFHEVFLSILCYKMFSSVVLVLNLKLLGN